MIDLANCSFHQFGFADVPHDLRDIPVDVGVPVHNALADVKRCLKSLVDNATRQTRIVVVDDGSDWATRQWIERFSSDHHLELIVHSRALGYTRAANAILEASRGRYVVLLNSDTIVTPGWIEAIVRCGESSPDIGVIGPLSNAASWQTVPDLYAAAERKAYAINLLPGDWSAADLSFAVGATPAVRPPRVPLVNGFCYIIKRATLSTVGLFDEKSFPLGYGEEDDYTFRAWDAGFSAALAMDAYVFHAKSRSFGSRRLELSAAGGAALRQRWPRHRIEGAVKTMREHPVLDEKRRLVRAVYGVAASGFSGVNRPVLELADRGAALGGIARGLENLGLVVQSPVGTETQQRRAAPSRLETAEGDGTPQDIVVAALADEDGYLAFIQPTGEDLPPSEPGISQRVIVPGADSAEQQVRRIATTLLFLSLARTLDSAPTERRPARTPVVANKRSTPAPKVPSGRASLATRTASVASVGSPDVASSSLDPYLVRFDASASDIAASRRITDGFRSDPRTDLGTVAWFVPAFEHVLRGGLRTIFSVAADLNAHYGTRNIFVLCADGEGDGEGIASHVAEHFPDLPVDYVWHRYGDSTVDLPPAGAGICTLWTTAYELIRYNQCQAKFYFAQDWEPSFYEAGSRGALIEQTYQFGFVVLANSRGVAERCRRFEEWVGYFTPGVDQTLFFPSTEGESSPPHRLVFYGRPRNARNGFALGIEALRRVKAAYGNSVDLISVGAEFEEDVYGLAGVVRNLGVLRSLEEVAALYRTCDVGLVFMYTAHPSYQPLEYMASGCVTITNFNPSNAWLLRDKENCVIAPSTVSGISDAICDLLADDALRRQVARGGVETARNLSWADGFAAIRSFLAQPTPAALGSPERDLAHAAHGIPAAGNGSP
jgi:GT2 family glycosyltransferase/glycosyltransferase involved in cell wall biosynthesis